MENITQQILAMYIGQQVQTPDGIGLLYSVSTDGVCVVTFGAMGPDFDMGFIFDQVKPILRPLKDMTEQEARELYVDHFSQKWEASWQCQNGRESCLQNWWRYANEWYLSGTQVACGKPSVWAKLLEMGFDLFNLIPAGLAVDKTKI